MKTILIPIDFSEVSMRCCRYAINLIGKEDALLVIYHIYPDQLMIPDSSFPVGVDNDSFINADFIAGLRKQSQENMDNFINELSAYLKSKKITNIRIEHRITGGDPEWEIHDLIKEINPEFIVMGTSGDAKKGFLEGNVAEKIMNKTSIPVFVVPNSELEINFKNVMYATNLDERDFNHIKTLVEFFVAFNSNFHVVHFKMATEPADIDSKMDNLKSLITKEFTDKSIRFHMFDGSDKDESLKIFVESNKIDLIAFLAHKKGIFKRIFSHKIQKKDFFKLELPMMALHEE